MALGVWAAHPELVGGCMLIVIAIACRWVGGPELVGQQRGYFKCEDDAFVPEKVAATWEVIALECARLRSIALDCASRRRKSRRQLHLMAVLSGSCIC